MKLRSSLLSLLICSIFLLPANAQKVAVQRMVSIRFLAPLSSATVQEGALWNATLTEDLQLGGITYARAGDKVIGTVLAVRPGAGREVRGTLKLRIQSIRGVPVESGAVTRTALGDISPSNPKGDAVIAAGDAISFYVIVFG